MNLILDLWMLHTERIISNIFCDGQRSFEVTRGQTLQNLKICETATLLAKCEPSITRHMETLLCGPPRDRVFRST